MKSDLVTHKSFSLGTSKSSSMKGESGAVKTDLFERLWIVTQTLDNHARLYSLT